MLQLNLPKKITAALIACLLVLSANAQPKKVTAIKSGLLTDPTTWAGGILPSLTFNSSDTIVIPKGITVTMNNDLYVGYNGMLQIDTGAMLQTLTGNNLTFFTNSVLAGKGDIDVDSIAMQGTYIDFFTGTITADIITLTGASFASDATVIINKKIYLSSTINFYNNSFITFSQANGEIISSNGSLHTNSTVVDSLNKPYTLRYIINNVTPAQELQGSGLKEIFVNLNIGSSINMPYDFELKCPMRIITGVLKLNAHEFTMGRGETLFPMPAAGYLLQGTQR